MRALVRPLAACALALGGLLAGPAHAACVGEQSIAYVCVTTPTVVVGERTFCVFAGGNTCKPVTVPTAGVTGQTEVECGGMLGCESTICEAQNLIRCPLATD